MRAASIGECMIEVSGSDTAARIGFGGDTLNTAVYLARLGIATDYVTALGDDPLSQEMVEAWRSERVGTELVARIPGRQPGLYVIRTDQSGERRFYYWREQAPARQLFELPGARELCKALRNYDLIYLSGITLSLYTDSGRTTLLDALKRARAGGARIAFDPNYRPAGWPSPDVAAAAFHQVLSHVDIALPSLDDEDSVHTQHGVTACLDRLRAARVHEAVVKRGPLGCVVFDGIKTTELPAQATVEPVDTTAAGDSFNAGYLAARLRGRPPERAAGVGGELAASVVQHRGAIVPAAAMPVDLL